MAVKGFKFSELIGGVTDSLDSQDGDTLSNGDFAMVIKDNVYYPYVLDETSGETESSPDIIAPDTNPGDKRWKLARMPSESTVPCGCIIPWLGGYFTNDSNDDYQQVLGNGNTIDDINDYLQDTGFRVCDGAEYNNAESPIFNGAGRHLPNLTDDRFIMGDSQCGGGRNGSGGDTSQNTINHNHTFAHKHSVDIAQFNSGSTTLSISQIPAHKHQVPHLKYRWVDVANGNGHGWEYDNGDPYSSYDTTSVGGGGSHYHTVNPPSTDTGNPIDATRTGITQHDNRPNWLGCVYIMRVL